MIEKCTIDYINKMFKDNDKMCAYFTKNCASKEDLIDFREAYYCTFGSYSIIFLIINVSFLNNFIFAGKAVCFVLITYNI